MAKRVAVVGVGGAGCNVLRCIADGCIADVHLVAVGSDVERLKTAGASVIVQLDPHERGAPGNVATCRDAALRARAEIEAALADADLVMLATGLGGGTGSGAAPVIADVARSTGATVVAITTLPFKFEGSRRRKAAEWAVEQLATAADRLVVIENDNLRLRSSSIAAAFAAADNALVGFVADAVVVARDLSQIDELLAVHFAGLTAPGSLDPAA